VINWTERGGPQVEPPQQDGFGLGLIKREVGDALGGTIRIDFQPSGLQVNLRFPLEPNQA
jgi:two-component system, chemotaxis family, CheB/CheR fusion protein